MAAVVEFVEDLFESVGDAVGDVVEFVDDAAQHAWNLAHDGISFAVEAVGDVVEGAVEVVKDVGRAVDDVVNDVIPGGWVGVAAIAATVATVGMAGPAAAGTTAGTEAAASIGTAWEGASLGSVAEAAGSSALKGAGMGAIGSVLSGGDPLEGALKGGLTGGLAGGVGNLAGQLGAGANAAKTIGSIASTAATGGDPSKILENVLVGTGANALTSTLDLDPSIAKPAANVIKAAATGKDVGDALTSAAFNYGAGELGKELDIDKDIAQSLGNVAEAAATGKDVGFAATKELVSNAVKGGVNFVNKTVSEIYQDAIENGFSSEEAYTIANAPKETIEEVQSSLGTPEDENLFTSQETDEEGNTIYTYDDGSKLYVDAEGNPWDATEATVYSDVYDDTYSDVYNDPYAQGDTYTDVYELPEVQAYEASQQDEPSTLLENAPADIGGLPPVEVTAPAETTGGLSLPDFEDVMPGDLKLPSSVAPALTKQIMSSVAPQPVRRAPVSRARQVQQKANPTNTLAQTQAQANALLGTPGYVAPTGTNAMANMTPAQRMAAIAAANKKSQPFAEGGTVDPTEGFIDPQANKYLRALIMHGNRGNYNLPGYPFGQQFRLGMAEGGQTSQHKPKFFSEGGLNSLQNRFVKGDGDGTSDSIPAMLANGEFVIPADVVASLGNGSNDSGAHVLDEFLKTIRKHKRNANHKKLPPDSKGPLGYLLEAKRKVKK